uniref:Plasmid stabilization system protein ParE n=1 Tax=Candidatus Kentrum sp. LPFa TaxID=2126335 RepID=A0A450W455_9GAMM|nr:MAG: Plasmid stabilization system protein ParE [Candidatus Kentron sp. LPFa]
MDRTVRWTVRWTETATEDLGEVARFIARDSPYYAAAFVREVRNVARSLDFSLERGWVVPEADRTDIREIFVKSYRLIYQVTNREVFILAFLHGARDLASLGGRLSKTVH